MRAEERVLTKVLQSQDEVSSALEYLRSCFPGGLLESARWKAQHQARAWEYRLALHAIDTWWYPHPVETPTVWDVGGAGSPLAWMIARQFGLPVRIVDPAEDGCTLHGALTTAKVRPDIITSISTIEHVKGVGERTLFIHDLCRALQPGGLLFLTTDFWWDATRDIHQFHWMRDVIYNDETWPPVFSEDAPLRRFGGVATVRPASPTPVVYDYTFASACWIKEA